MKKLFVLLPLLLASCVTHPTPTPQPVTQPPPGPVTGNPLALSLEGNIKLSENTSLQDSQASGGSLALQQRTFDGQGMTFLTLGDTVVSQDARFTLNFSRAALDAALVPAEVGAEQPECTGKRLYSDLTNFKYASDFALNLDTAGDTIALNLRPAGQPPTTETRSFELSYANGPATLDVDMSCSYGTAGSSNTYVTKAKVSYRKGWNLHRLSYVRSGTDTDVTVTITAVDEPLPTAYTLAPFPVVAPQSLGTRPLAHTHSPWFR